MTFVSIDPADATEHARYDDHAPDEVERRVAAAHEAHLTWRNSAFAERSERLRALAALLRKRQDVSGALLTREMGKPVSGGLAHAKKWAWV